MSQLSNAHGIVVADEDFAIGIHNGHEIGRLPLPLKLEDATMMIRLCLAADGYDFHDLGDTAKMFVLKDLMQWTFRAGQFYGPTHSRGYTSEQVFARDRS